MNYYNGYSENYAIGAAMIRYGGSFAENLGRALQNADTENSKKIRDTWPELIERYKEMALKMEQFQNA